jgi:hypothetical protein
MATEWVVHINVRMGILQRVVAVIPVLVAATAAATAAVVVVVVAVAAAVAVAVATVLAQGLWVLLVSPLTPLHSTP